MSAQLARSPFGAGRTSITWSSPVSLRTRETGRVGDRMTNRRPTDSTRLDTQKGTRARRVHEGQGTDVEAELSTLSVHGPGHGWLESRRARDVQLAGDVQGLCSAVSSESEP